MTEVEYRRAVALALEGLEARVHELEQAVARLDPEAPDPLGDDGLEWREDYTAAQDKARELDLDVDLTSPHEELREAIRAALEGT